MVRLCWLGLHLMLGLVLAASVFRWGSRSRQERTLSWWSARLLRILRVQLIIRGGPPQPNGGGLVIASNHISWLDVFVIHALRPARFVAKSEIRSWPVLGWLAAQTGTLFIERGRRHHTAKINEAMRDTLMQGHCVALFPEATTTRGDHLKKFHSSLLESVVASGATLACVGICYKRQDGEKTEVTAFVDDLTLLASLRQILRQPRMIAEIHCGPVLTSIGKTRRELALEAEVAIASLLGLPTPHRKPETAAGLAA